MPDDDVEQLLRRWAPRDVQDAVAWLLGHGYVMTSHQGSSAAGAQLELSGQPGEGALDPRAPSVVVTADRGQWALDVVGAPGLRPWQLDLLLAARAGRPWAEVFPDAGERETAGRLPDQLPVGVSWAEELPQVLDWVTSGDDDVGAAVDQARRERSRALDRPRR